MRNQISALILGLSATVSAEWIWIEGEDANPEKSKVSRHPWWYDQVKTNEFSGGGFVSHWSAEEPGLVTYPFEVESTGGEFHFWVRANPVQSRLAYSINEGPFAEIDLERGKTGITNVADDEKPDLRFLAWSNAGTVTLRAGRNQLSFKMLSANHYHGMLDCFVLTREAFQPQGTSKPGEAAAALKILALENEDWCVWSPEPDRFKPSVIDLRRLNESSAGVVGRIRVEDGRFVLGSGEPVRFWAVNGPPANLRGDDLRRCARMLAKRGVNLVRIHSSIFHRETGELDSSAIPRIQEVVAAMKAEGIYTHLSIYFPLWFTPKPGLPLLSGYDGKSHPFAALYFHSAFQEHYLSWWREVLTTSGNGGESLLDEPALMGLELVNEDSYFFWTFNDNNLPALQLEVLESQFAEWAVAKYGSPEKVDAAWNGLKLPRDGSGRLGFRPLYQMFNDRTPRDRDTATFLFGSQRAFYQGTVEFLRNLGFKGLITASNWTTANDDVLGPLEWASYLAGNFIDRHGYFAGKHEGEHAAWSIREGHTYRHRSALGLESESSTARGAPVSHPAFDLKINGYPSMISETTFNRPNRFRTEAPMFYAAYGALQGSDAIVHFALDSAEWSVKPGFFMQPWTLMTPAMMGQFPAAALLYRQGLVGEGDLMGDFFLSMDDALALKGSPLSRPAHLDALRQADVSGDAGKSDSSRVDSRIHLIGRSRLTIGEGGKSKLLDLSPFIDPDAQTVTSSNNQLVLDHSRRFLKISAPKVQGAVGNLEAAGEIVLPQLHLSSDLDLAAVVLVSLDGEPLDRSASMLLQVMTEERPSGFAEVAEGDGTYRIVALGRDPWLIRQPRGRVNLQRPDAGGLKVTALDANGYEVEVLGVAGEFHLRPDTVYYHISR